MLDILLAHPAANLVGIVCVVLGVTWPLYKTRKGLLWAQAAVHVAFSTHFLLLGALTASLMNALGLAQALAAIPLGNRPGFKIIYLLTLPLIATGAFFTWQGLPSVFSSLALALFSIARYMTNTLSMRAFMMLGILSWTTHDLLVMSIPALTTDVLSFATSIWMIRFERRLIKTQTPQNETA